MDNGHRYRQRYRLKCPCRFPWERKYLAAGGFIQVIEELEDGGFLKVRRFFMPSICRQFAKPSFLHGVPEDTYINRANGILVFHYEKLRSGEVFETIEGQCPFPAVYHDAACDSHPPQLEPYETRENYVYGK